MLKLFVVFGTAIVHAVRWVETIQTFAGKGIQHIIECGPGKVLTGLNKRIVSEIQLAPTADFVSLQLLLDNPALLAG